MPLNIFMQKNKFPLVQQPILNIQSFHGLTDFNICCCLYYEKLKFKQLRDLENIERDNNSNKVQENVFLFMRQIKTLFNKNNSSEDIFDKFKNGTYIYYQTIFLLNNLNQSKSMSISGLTARNRTASSVSIRKRILRSNSQDNRDWNKQQVKNSTATSFRPKLQRLIQQGKLEQIIYSDPHNKGDLFYRTQINQMEKELAMARKSLSTMVLKSKAKQYSINKLKHQIIKLQHQSGVIKNESKIITKNLAEKEETLEQIKESHEQSIWKEKSYIQLKKRLYDDQKYLIARHEHKDKQFSKVNKEFKDLETKYHELSQFNRELQRMVNQAKKISRQQVSQKNQFIDLLNDQMQEKQYIDQLKTDKKLRDKQINHLSSSQIEKEQLAKYLQIHTTHQILGQIIKTKSNRLIEKYSDVQRAYMHIKSNTNIVETDKLLARMEQQDQFYQAALKRVNSLQVQLKQIQAKMLQEVQHHNDIYSMGGQQNKQVKSVYQGMAQDQYELLESERQKLFNRKRQDQILTKKLHLWALQYFPHYHIRKSQTKDFLQCLKQFVYKIDNKSTSSAKLSQKNKVKSGRQKIEQKQQIERVIYVQKQVSKDQNNDEKKMQKKLQSNLNQGIQTKN